MTLFTGGEAFKSGVDAPEMGDHAKCKAEGVLALETQARSKKSKRCLAVSLVAERGVKDRTSSRRPLIDICRWTRDWKNPLCLRFFSKHGHLNMLLVCCE